MIKHTRVQDNRDHLIILQFGSASQWKFHELFDGLDVTSVAFVWTFQYVPFLISDDIRPFLRWLSCYMVWVASVEDERTPAASCVLSTHCIFEIKTWSTCKKSVTQSTSTHGASTDVFFCTDANFEAFKKVVHCST